MVDITQPVEQYAARPANALTIVPSFTDPKTGQVYVHHDLLATDADWQIEQHIPPISRTEKFGDVASWAEYVLNFEDGARAPLLTWSERGLTAILDYHGSEANPGRCSWIATHDFVKSRQWCVWTGLANGQARGQKAILEALEDNQADIVDPVPAELLTVLRTLRATSSATADTELLADGSTKIVWQKQSGVRSGELQLPSEFRIRIPVLKGHMEPSESGKMQPVYYGLAVRIRASVDDQAKLALRLSIPAAEQALEDVFADQVATAQALLGSERQLYRAAER